MCCLVYDAMQDGGIWSGMHCLLVFYCIASAELPGRGFGFAGSFADFLLAGLGELQVYRHGSEHASFGLWFLCA